MDLKNSITSFIEGNINFFLRKKDAPVHIREQILYRMLKCAPCTNNGKCLGCKCPTPKLFFAPHKEDSRKNWEPFFRDKEEWEEFKISNSLSTLASEHPNIVSQHQALWS